MAGRDPQGPHVVTIPACRARHVRFNDLAAPVQVPRGTYSA
ncbi:sensory rhodopsin transducer [Lentzea sp. NEAU-D7]